MKPLRGASATYFWSPSGSTVGSIVGDGSSQIVGSATL
jgi:hypothetical protein